MNNQELKKAKEYALRSLTNREQTEFQIRTKLQRKGYEEEVIETTVAFLKDYNYMNDQRFTEQYIAGHCQKMNRRELQQQLYAKGIKSNDTLDTYLELYEYNEEAVLEKALDKYIRNKDITEELTQKKVIAYFMQKGYSYGIVRSVLRKKTDIIHEGGVNNE
ncbi:MAG: regulatory protein RecX [Lachnospiraceae bacterium]|nr:regulatory protein RecX [Lachnospiraceae bacterium]